MNVESAELDSTLAFSLWTPNIGCTATVKTRQVNVQILHIQYLCVSDSSPDLAIRFTALGGNILPPNKVVLILCNHNHV